jgi:UDP-GlcNAc:undecaprenyl-phosphate/decaprenyl-phosphate GlcNAc-1-phosphate transferase
MKVQWIMILLVVLLVAPAYAQQPSAPQTTTPQPSAQQPPTSQPTAPQPQLNPAFKTQMEQVSYAIGADIARGLKQNALEVDMDTLVKGLRDSYSGEKALMTEAEIRTTLVEFSAELRRKQIAAMQKAAEENKKAGEAFLTENAKKEGVVTLPDGLQYKVLKAGTGKKPTDADTVECTYRGTLINGTEFDSSSKHGGTATFQVGKVIPGWKEALKLMPVGSNWQLFVPSNLAYGLRGSPPNIGPNETLIFEMELVEIKQPIIAPSSAK